MKKILILCFILSCITVAESMSQNCEIIGVFNLKSDISYSTNYNIKNRKVNTSTNSTERHFIVLNNSGSGLATIYNIEIVTDKAPLYTKRANALEYQSIKTLKILNQCTHLINNNNIQKTQDRHQHCPVDLYFYGINGYVPIRDTSNPFMSLNTNDNITVNNIQHNQPGNSHIRVTASNKITKVSWSNNYTNSVYDILNIILKSELPYVKIGLDNHSDTPGQIDTDNSQLKSTENIWGRFIKELLPTNPYVRTKDRPYNEKTIRDFQIKRSNSFSTEYYKDGFYDSLGIKYDLSNKCLILQDAIYGLSAGLIIDLYSKQSGIFTRDEFSVINDIRNTKYTRYNYMDSLINQYNKLSKSVEKKDTTVDYLNKQITKLESFGEYLKRFKTNFVDEYFNRPISLLEYDNDYGIDSTIYYSLRNIIRSESDISTYGSMIDSNLYAFYDRIYENVENSYAYDDNKRESILEYKLNSQNLRNEYDKSKVIPTINVASKLVNRGYKNIYRIDTLLKDNNKTPSQLKGYLRHYKKNILDLSDSISHMSKDVSLQNDLISKLNDIFEVIDGKLINPKYVTYSNFSIKHPFNSFYENRYHRRLLNVYVAICTDILKKKYNDNDVINLNVWGFREPILGLKSRFRNYQQILPMMISFITEFNKDSSGISLINNSLWSKLAVAFELDSNRFNSDLEKYFSECKDNGPTIDFFNEDKHYAFYWGDNYKLIADSLHLVLASLDHNISTSINDLKKKRDDIKRELSGIDKKVTVNMINYPPYRSYVNYYQLVDPEVTVDSLTKLNIDLPPTKIDSIYNIHKKDVIRLKQIEKNSTFILFRNDTVIETIPSLLSIGADNIDYSRSQIQKLLKQYIIDSIESLKSYSVNPQVLDQVYKIYNPPTVYLSKIRDSIKSIYNELYNEYFNIRFMNYIEILEEKWYKSKGLSDVDSIKQYSAWLKKEYFKSISNYGKNYVPLEDLVTSINTNIPRIDLPDLCTVISEYEITKGNSTSWNTNSHNLLIESIRYLFFINRSINQRGQYYGSYHHSGSLLYDIDGNQWISESSNTDETYWWIRKKSCLQHYFIGLKILGDQVKVNSLYFNILKKNKY